MKSFVALFALVAVVAADVAHLRSPEADATILRQEQDVLPDQYQYSYETSNGIVAQESGVLRNVGLEQPALTVQGSHSYYAPNGEPIALVYTADENGYRAEGAHLPTPPPTQPLPDYVAKAIAFINANSPPQDSKP